MKTNNISREYKIDYISEKIIVTKKFLKAAGVYNSPEYKLMKELRADYPAFAFEEKKIDKKAGKVTHKNLTFEKMREHLVVRFGKDSDTVKRYDYLMEFYKPHAGRYAKIKSWYLEQCKDEYADENEASEASSESSEASTANVLTMPR